MQELYSVLRNSNLSPVSIVEAWYRFLLLRSGSKVKSILPFLVSLSLLKYLSSPVYENVIFLSLGQEAKLFLFHIFRQISASLFFSIPVLVEICSFDYSLDFKKELRSLNRELQLNILELADVLVERPSQYARRVEDISLIFKNLYHLLNSLRPHQVK